jgi:hypothetical protein
MILTLYGFRTIFIQQHNWGTACVPGCDICENVWRTFSFFSSSFSFPEKEEEKEAKRDEEMQKWGLRTEIEWVLPTDDVTGDDATMLPIAYRAVKTGANLEACKNCMGLLRCENSHLAVVRTPLYTYDDVIFNEIHIAFAATFYLSKKNKNNPRSILRLYTRLMLAELFQLPSSSSSSTTKRAKFAI